MTRIAVAGIYLESNTFSSLSCVREDFAEFSDLGFLEPEVLASALEEKIELLPAFYARVVPAGVLNKDSFDYFLSKILKTLCGLTYDAVLLDLHGSLVVEPQSSGDKLIIDKVREAVGPDTPIGVTFDLHGNIDSSVVENADYITALRTAPHTDQAETTLRAIRALDYIVKNKSKPGIKVAKLPLLLPGEAMMTDTEPAATLYGLLGRDSIATTGLEANIFCGFPWADTEHKGVAVAVTGTRTDEELGIVADGLADAIKAQREDFELTSSLLTTEDAFDMLHGAREPLFFSDTGDNITAGAAGDSLELLKFALNKSHRDGLFAPIYVPEYIEKAIKAGPGGHLEIDGLTPEPQLAKIKSITTIFGAQVAFVDFGSIHAIFTGKRIPFVRQAQFKALMIDPSEYAFCVFKLGYLYPELVEYGVRSVLIDTPGPTRLDISKLNFRNSAWAP